MITAIWVGLEYKARVGTDGDRRREGVSDADGGGRCLQQEGAEVFTMGVILPVCLSISLLSN